MQQQFYDLFSDKQGLMLMSVIVLKGYSPKTENSER